MTSGQYTLVGSYGEALHAVLERMVACTECGAVVIDTLSHDRWHDESARYRKAT